MGKFKKRFDLVEREEIVKKASLCLWTESGRPGYNYLTKDRKLSEDTLRTFRVGYIPFYVKHQLRGRVILPLYDPTGNLIAVGSRSIVPTEGFPAYWHESYEKSYYVYGMDVACESIRKHKFALVVEGQFDVLQLYSHGVSNVVALCGNKMSDVQMSVVNRYCSDVIILLDRDANKAGQAGASKIIDERQTLEASYDSTFGGDVGSFPAPRYHSVQEKVVYSRPIAVATFPENADPDEFVKKHGINELKKIVRGKLHELRNRTS